MDSYKRNSLRTKGFLLEDDSIFYRLAKRDVIERDKRRKDLEWQYLRELRSLQNSGKCSTHSRVVYKQRLRKNLRSAVDFVQPSERGSLRLATPLLPKCLEHLGFLQRSQQFEAKSCHSAASTEKAVEPKAASEREEIDRNYFLETELPGLLTEWLDETKRGYIEVDKLYQLLCWLSCNPLELLHSSQQESLFNGKIPEKFSDSSQASEDSSESGPTRMRGMEDIRNVIKALLFNHAARDRFPWEQRPKEQRSFYFQPQVSTLSSDLAKRARLRVLNKPGSDKLSIQSLPIYFCTKAELTKEKLQKQREDKLAEEMQHCTFYPETRSSLRAKDKTFQSCGNSDKDFTKTDNSIYQESCTREGETHRTSRNHFLYYSGMQQAQLNSALVEEVKRKQEQKELKECSFEPKTWSKSINLYGAVAKPNGFEKSVNRLRLGQRQREERLKAAEKATPNAEVMNRAKQAKPFTFEEGRYKVKLNPEIFSLTVHLSKQRQAKVVIHENDIPEEVARNFAKTYALSKHYEQLVADVIKKKLEEMDKLPSLHNDGEKTSLDE